MKTYWSMSLNLRKHSFVLEENLITLESKDIIQLSAIAFNY